jgi:hypothetical protein
MYCTWIQRWLAMFLDFRVELCIWIPTHGWTMYLDPIFWRGWRSSHLVWDLKAIETCCSEISKIRLFSSKVGKQEYNIEYLFYSFLHVANTKKSPFFVKNSQNNGAKSETVFFVVLASHRHPKTFIYVVCHQSD